MLKYIHNIYLFIYSSSFSLFHSIMIKDLHEKFQVEKKIKIKTFFP